MCSRNLEADVKVFYSFKTGKPCLGTQVLWNCAGEVQWVSESYPAGTHDQGVMGLRSRSEEYENYYAELFTLYPVAPNLPPYISADTAYTHKNIISPKKGKKGQLSSEDQARGQILKGLGTLAVFYLLLVVMRHTGLSITEKGFAALKVDLQFLKK